MVNYLKDHAELIVALITIITFTWTVITKFVYKPIREVISTLENHSIVLKELQPNGGGSIKDRVMLASQKIGEIDSSVNYIKSLALSQLDLIQYPIWKSDSEGNTTFINDSYKELFEIDFDDSKGYKWTSLIHKEDTDSYLKEWKDSLKYKKSVNTDCRLLTFRTKKEIRCRVSWKVITNQSDEIVYIIGKIQPLQNGTSS
jgi:PAS domain-containing protein